MKTLYILRHAKSSWDDHTLSDFERPLNQRGLNTAPFMGELMKKQGFFPDVIVSSPAVRAKQTAELVRETAQFEPQIRFDEQIYEASVGTLVSVLSEIEDSNDFVLLVGHNPGTESLIYYITGEIAPMPTASLGVVELYIETWSEMAGGCGTLKQIIRPKEAFVVK